LLPVFGFKLIAVEDSNVFPGLVEEKGIVPVTGDRPLADLLEQVEDLVEGRGNGGNWADIG
jgi:hypothetical protein